MFWLLLCLFFVTNTSDVPERKTLTDLPTELIKKIAYEHRAGSGVKISTKPFYKRLFIPDVERYIETHEDPEATARANLSAMNFDLDHFMKDTYAGLPPELREEISQKYQKFMQDPVFFLKFAPFKNGFTIPKYLSERIRDEKINIPGQHISIDLFTPLDEDKKEILDKKCIVMHYYFLNLDEFQTYLQYIDNTYQKSFIRLVVNNIFSEFDKYKDWPTKYIIQDTINGNTLFHNFSNNLANYTSINTEILKTKNLDGNTPLFYQSFDTIHLFPKVYINERNNDGFSALGWQLNQYRKNSDRSEETRNKLIKNIKELIANGAHLDIQSFEVHDGERVPYSNPIHEAVLINDLEIVEIVSTGDGFDRAINQLMESKEFPDMGVLPPIATPLNYARRLTSDERIKKFLESNGALRSSYIEVGMNPLHFYAQHPHEIAILKDLLKRRYYQSPLLINAVDQRGHTPLDYAILVRKREFDSETLLKIAEVITLLESYGAKKHSQTIKSKMRSFLLSSAQEIRDKPVQSALWLALFGYAIYEVSKGLPFFPSSPIGLQWQSMGSSLRWARLAHLLKGYIKIMDFDPTFFTSPTLWRIWRLQKWR